MMVEKRSWLVQVWFTDGRYFSGNTSLEQDARESYRLYKADPRVKQVSLSHDGRVIAVDGVLNRD